MKQMKSRQSWDTLYRSQWSLGGTTHIHVIIIDNGHSQTELERNIDKTERDNFNLHGSVEHLYLNGLDAAVLGAQLLEEHQHRLLSAIKLELFTG